MRRDGTELSATGSALTRSFRVVDAHNSQLAQTELGAAMIADPDTSTGTEFDVGMDAAQLAVLASTVLQKSHDDLTALAENDPSIVWNWIEAFARLKAKAEADARLWSAAMASLSTATSPLAAAE